VSLLRPAVSIPFLAGLGGFLYFAFGRGYPFGLALLMGAALMLLGWTGARTWKGLRDLGRH
jgi:hypothetical protein